MHPLWKIMEVSQKTNKQKKNPKTKIRTNIGHSNFIPGFIYPKKYINLKRYAHPSVHSSINYNSQDM